MNILPKPLAVLAAGGVFVTLIAVAHRPPRKSAPVTAPSPTVTPDPAGVIYDDDARNGWRYSRDSPDFSAKSDTVCANGCIRTSPGPNNVLYFWRSSMMSVKPYDRITFRIRGAESGAKPLELMTLLLEESVPSIRYRPLNRNVNPSRGDAKSLGERLSRSGPREPEPVPPVIITPVPGEWKTVTIPLEALGIAGQKNLITFGIQNIPRTRTTPVFYVDDVRFLRPVDPAPAE